MDFEEDEAYCDLSMSSGQLPDTSSISAFSGGTAQSTDNLSMSAIPTSVVSRISYDMDNGISVRPSAASFKRWNSMPMGINLSCSPRRPEPSPPSSSSSSSSDDDDSEQTNDSETCARNIPMLEKNERKSMSVCGFGRRSSNTFGSVCIPRHRSSSSVLYKRPFRLLDRGIEKLKREANLRNCIETDYAGEKMSVTGAAIMNSMDEFNIADGEQNDLAIGILEQRRRAQSLTEPVHVMTNLLPASCSPSPTGRVEKQCYSPSMQQIVRSVAMSPTPVSSPSRRQCIRSLSPIALRIGMGMGLKRKYELDGEGNASVPTKRVSYFMSTTPPATAVENVRSPIFGLATQNMNYSLSESSIDSECSSSTVSSDYANVSLANQPGFLQRPLSSNNPICSTTAAATEGFPEDTGSIADEHA